MKEIKFDLIPGTERKSTGSYYTPPALVQELIKSALEPVLEDRLSWAKRVANGEWRTANGEWNKEVIENVRAILSRSGYKNTPKDSEILKKLWLKLPFATRYSLLPTR